MEVHVLHRNDLSVTATSGAALHPKVWPQRCFADADGCLFADAVQTIAKTHGRGRLALASRCRVYRGNEDQLAFWLVTQTGNKRLADFRLIMTKGYKIGLTNPKFCTDFHDRLFVGFTRNLNVGFVGHSPVFPSLNPAGWRLTRYTPARARRKRHFRHFRRRLRRSSEPCGAYRKL